MITYYHPTQATPPEWLVGAAELLGQPRAAGGYAYGAGPLALLGGGGGPAVPLAGGWAASVARPLIPCPRRLPGWVITPVKDRFGDYWAAPTVVNEAGVRQFPVSYGVDWKPILTPEQERLLDIAKNVLTDLPLYLNGSAQERDALTPTLMAWAAEALAASNHTTVEALAGLGLMDDYLMVGVLTVLAPTDA